MDGCRTAGAAQRGGGSRLMLFDCESKPTSTMGNSYVNGSNIIPLRVEVGGSSRVMNGHMGQNDYRKYETPLSLLKERGEN